MIQILCLVVSTAFTLQGWTRNGSIDYSMIVTQKTGNSHPGIKVTYDSSDGYTPKRNISLGSTNNISTVFYVYRPMFYNEWETGLLITKKLVPHEKAFHTVMF